MAFPIGKTPNIIGLGPLASIVWMVKNSFLLKLVAQGLTGDPPPHQHVPSQSIWLHLFQPLYSAKLVPAFVPPHGGGHTGDRGGNDGRSRGPRPQGRKACKCGPKKKEERKAGMQRSRFRPFCPSSNFFGRAHLSSGKRASGISRPLSRVDFSVGESPNRKWRAAAPSSLTGNL